MEHHVYPRLLILDFVVRMYTNVVCRHYCIVRHMGLTNGFVCLIIFVSALVPPSENKRSEHNKDDGLPVDIKLPVKHVLSRELQVLVSL